MGNVGKQVTRGSNTLRGHSSRVQGREGSQSERHSFGHMGARWHGHNEKDGERQAQTNGAQVFARHSRERCNQLESRLGRGQNSEGQAKRQTRITKS